MNRQPHARDQQGMILIMLLLMVALAATAFILNSLNSDAMRIEQETRTAAALYEAKVALTGRAVADANHPGSLPCPDGDNDGSADAFAGNDCPAYIGRLPWKTLGIGNLKDSAGETLWYALSSNYRDHTSAEPINGSVLGSLKVDGISDRVAVIFAPGPPLSFQTGRPSNTVSDYLESENADGDMDFSQLISATQNDRLISIGRTELFNLVAQRILGEIKGDSTQGMKKYYATYAAYPFADIDGDGNADASQYSGRTSWQAGPDSLFFNSATKSMLLNNQWMSTVNYAVTNTRQNATLSAYGKTLSIAP